jgi:hypothetical protein
MRPKELLVTQPSLFDRDPTRHYHRGNPESDAAHRSIVGEKARMRAIVVGAVREAGSDGRTSDEIEVITGMPHQTVSARLTEAKALGEVVVSGQRRPTRSGRSAAVLVIPR